jgi:hypothetical protein
MPNAGEHYVELIKEQLQAEETRKQSLEQRGVLVITAAASLSTLLLGLTGLITSIRGLALPPGAAYSIAASIGLFLIAAVVGILINRPTKYRGTDESSLRRIVDDEEYWGAAEVIGMRRTSENRLDMLEGARGSNDKKARLLTLGLSLEVAGAAAAGTAATVIVSQ